MTLHHKTLRELSALLHSKSLSSVELTQHYLNRIREHDKKLNAFITVTPEKALALAKKADEKIARGESSLLCGIPIAHKDIFCTKEIKTTCGSRMLDNFIAPYNATAVQQLENAGCVLLGKTNMDEFAMGSSNENSYYGTVKNPWDLKTVPGGSSGGSAAAIAAGFTPAATGTDTGGSIRQPAALSGITGLKPTYGRVSRYGMVAYASSLDQGGPMAKTAEDTALLFNAMAGFDSKDSTSCDKPVPDFTATLNQDLKGMRIGLPEEYFDKKLSSDMATRIHDAAKILEKCGASLHSIRLPTVALSLPAYYIIAPAEAASNLARYDGVRYGYRCDNPRDLEDLYRRSRNEGFGSEVKRRILMGTYVLSAGYYDAYYHKAQKIRRLIQNDFQKAFETVDIILGPTTPSPAFNIGEKQNDPATMYLGDIYTIPNNLAGLPGISIPAGFIGKLPIGLQLTGRHFEEASILNAAHRYQQITDFHLKTPGDF